MSDAMQYKGYVGSAHFSDEDGVFHGRLEGIRDLVSYEGTDVPSLKSAFTEAVDDYLATCRKKKRTLDVPFKGTFNVRVGSELHKRAALYAAEHHKKLNSVVGEALEKFLEAAG
ncbi:MAG: type II toxin-antitoxin system HicB family antitoxin [Bryobacteraceae bacterium]